MRAPLLSLSILLGCASASGAAPAKVAPRERSAGAAGEEVASSSSAPSAPAPGGSSNGAADPPYLGVLDRAGLLAIIDQGLGHVLARLKVSPVLVKGRFQGFRVNAVDAAWSECGVRVDDVLVALNGQSIERPEQAVIAFESLRVASELSLQLVRGGEPVALRYRIE